MKKILKKILWLVLLLVALDYNRDYQFFAFHPFAGEDECDLTLLTWNIHDSGKDFDVRQREMADFIQDRNPDVVFLSEFCLRLSPYLDSVMRASYPYVVDKWSAVRAGNVFYSRYPIVRSRHLCGEGLYPLVHEITVSVDGREVKVVGCHLVSTNNQDPNHRYKLGKWSDLKTIPAYYELYKKGKALRAREAKLLVERLHEDSLPALVVGDMNDFSGMAPLDVLHDAGLHNAWWEGGFGTGFTFHEGWMRLRIDHVLFNDSLRLSDIQVIQSDLSDHYPLVARFLFK